MLIVCFARLVQFDLNMNAAIELRTGLEKKAVIASLV